ncbi:hypothetical protein Cgig2_004484 [Carnegiea gigantea]|uniref:Uncharacterized protein n=1 Tax=Carnegiea gigantea TaxID=171969 RepID=A0A9Q1JRN1_9CARY|nr:hypothetical protein Cgig2_004484 [Carnegiea gigantea]
MAVVVVVVTTTYAKKGASCFWLWRRESSRARKVKDGQRGREEWRENSGRGEPRAMNRFKVNIMSKLMEMLPNRIPSIKLSRNNPIRNPSAIQVDPNLQDPLFIQIEMRLIVTKENGNIHLGCGTSLQRFPFQMCQGSLKIVCGVCKTEYEMHTGWGIGTITRHLETYDILKDSGISLNQAQIFGFPGPKLDAEDDEDEIDQFVQLSFSSDSEALGGSSTDEAINDDE